LATTKVSPQLQVENESGTAPSNSRRRFLLGLGVSHVPLVEGMRGHAYEQPVPKMRSYLEAMAKLELMAPPPPEKPRTVVAALGPKMLALAAERTDGAHPYLVTPEHTAEARAILGQGKWLCPEQKILLETDPATARAIARNTVGFYLTLPNYRNNLKRLGFGDGDFDQGGSDRLVDALVAWGDEDAIRSRIEQHWEAGADHVCVQPITAEGMAARSFDERILDLLAPAP